MFKLKHLKLFVTNLASCTPGLHYLQVGRILPLGSRVNPDIMVQLISWLGEFACQNVLPNHKLILFPCNSFCKKQNYNPNLLSCLVLYLTKSLAVSGSERIFLVLDSPKEDMWKNFASVLLNPGK